ncbi:L-fuconolactone hydrolase [Gracilibacillus boraciitolerans JCM 21714]|uniref:L-fuconolactone hydrolase n=1 Tax=Gracilibacillus boraciitolerans JCM 21714 TaxID=1298598 RepID=W4VMB9_9BACI|nr:amidohydrolase family protein [Gracilibacillus boraciitolerans]GAE94357.1 L-fuconolactone hydrolase [Gracilibacillus boraciitolerans JCM 21714]
MRIDAHQHYWKISRDDYGWINPDIRTLYRDFLERDLVEHLKKAGIEKTIVIQAAPTIEETEFILSLSDHSESIVGVVGWIDIDHPSYKEQLDIFRKHPKFVGIRIMIQDMPNETIILSEKYLEAFSYFGKIDLPVDLLITSSQLWAVSELLKRVKLRGVIDHIAKPEIEKGKLEPWKTQMAEIASYQNIYCKLSGMVTEANHDNWETKDMIPYVHHIVEVFGMHRIMYGSDWPVCLLAASYDQVYHLLNDALPSDVSTLDKEFIFGKNAIDFYKLNNIEEEEPF